MHEVIRIICYADSSEEARSKAEEILMKNLVGDGMPFDYGTFFDEDNGIGFGKTRWGNLPPVVLADSKEGKKLIDDGMKYTKEEFLRHLKEIREMINFYSDEELFEEEVMDTKKKILNSLENKKDASNILSFKYPCSCLGEYEGSNIYLYDGDGSGIRNEKQLKNVLEKWKSVYEDEGKENPNKDKKIYILPIDVHY